MSHQASQARGDPFGQEGYAVRFAWGAAGASRLAHPDGVLVVVDVLSFSTAVTIAVERGSSVYPCPRHDERAVRLARERGAVLVARSRRAQGDPGWSLSPASLLRGNLPPRIVLPSPNGSAIAAAATGPVVAACLRNAAAVAGWLRQAGFGSADRPVNVVAAGERWPDGGLRPAVEDLLGAGAVVSALAGGNDVRLSPEAAAARAAYSGVPSVADAVRRGASGLELAAAGFGDDVELAVSEAGSAVVPVTPDRASPFAAPTPRSRT